MQCSCLIEQGIKWKKKEDSLLLTYTDWNSIGVMRGRTRRENRLYPASFWNVKKRVEEDLPTTNNAAEGFHSALRSSITCKKILMSGNWLLHSKKEELQQTKIIHVNRGDAPPRKKIYKSIDRQLKTLVNTYDITATKFHFLITLQKYWLFSFY